MPSIATATLLRMINGRAIISGSNLFFRYVILIAA
jgi:hypothetical protein